MIARTPQEAAKVYPGDYWLSLLQPPAASEFPGTGAGQRHSAAISTQNHWVNSLKTDCNFCHQLGNQLTRALAHMDRQAGFKTHEEAWIAARSRRARQRDAAAFAQFGVQGRREDHRRLDERVAKGEVPPHAAAAEGRRAQRRRDAVGLGRPTTRSCTTRSPPTRTTRP